MKAVSKNQLLACGVALCCASWGTFAQSNSLFSLFYDSAGLTRVEIKQGQLHYTWHTLRQWGADRPVAVEQSLKSYDRHEALIWLTPEELNGFRQWAETNHLSRVHGPFPTKPGPASYGSAFQTTLALTNGTTGQNFKWNGDNQVPPNLTAAVQALVHVCQNIEERRRK